MRWLGQSTESGTQAALQTPTVPPQSSRRGSLQSQHSPGPLWAHMCPHCPSPQTLACLASPPITADFTVYPYKRLRTAPRPFRLSPLTAPHYPAGHTPTTPHCSAALRRSVRQHLPPPVDLISAACTCKEPVVVSICDSTAARGRALEIKVQKRKTATRHHELCDHNRAADCSSWPNNFNACGCIPIRSPFNPSVKQLYAL